MSNMKRRVSIFLSSIIALSSVSQLSYAKSNPKGTSLFLLAAGGGVGYLVAKNQKNIVAGFNQLRTKFNKESKESKVSKPELNTIPEVDEKVETEDDTPNATIPVISSSEFKKEEKRAIVNSLPENELNELLNQDGIIKEPFIYSEDEDATALTQVNEKKLNPKDEVVLSNFRAFMQKVLKRAVRFGIPQSLLTNDLKSTLTDMAIYVIAGQGKYISQLKNAKGFEHIAFVFTGWNSSDEKEKANTLKQLDAENKTDVDLLHQEMINANAWVHEKEADYGTHANKLNKAVTQNGLTVKSLNFDHESLKDLVKILRKNGNFAAFVESL